MALYDYRCGVCGKVTPLQYRMGEAPRMTDCDCGATANRVFGNCRFDVFKPYVTDELQEIAPWVRVESRREEREICKRLDKTRMK